MTESCTREQVKQDSAKYGEKILSEMWIDDALFALKGVRGKTSQKQVRGSSLTCEKLYTLGILNVFWLHFNKFFERFLNQDFDWCAPVLFWIFLCQGCSGTADLSLVFFVETAHLIQPVSRWRRYKLNLGRLKMTKYPHLQEPVTFPFPGFYHLHHTSSALCQKVDVVIAWCPSVLMGCCSVPASLVCVHQRHYIIKITSACIQLPWHHFLCSDHPNQEEC